MLLASLTGLIFSSKTQKIMYTITAPKLIMNKFLKASPLLKSRKEYCYTPVDKKYPHMNRP